MTKSELKDLVYQVNGAAIEVHKNLGPGLLESVYHKCLEKEFELRGIKFISELKIPIEYKGLALEADLRLDFLVEKNQLRLHLHELNQYEELQQELELVNQSEILTLV